MGLSPQKEIELKEQFLYILKQLKKAKAEEGLLRAPNIDAVQLDEQLEPEKLELGPEQLELAHEQLELGHEQLELVVEQLELMLERLIVEFFKTGLTDGNEYLPYMEELFSNVATEQSVDSVALLKLLEDAIALRGKRSSVGLVQLHSCVWHCHNVEAEKSFIVQLQAAKTSLQTEIKNLESSVSGREMITLSPIVGSNDDDVAIDPIKALHNFSDDDGKIQILQKLLENVHYVETEYQKKD